MKLSVPMDTNDDNQKTKSKITFLEAEECCLKLHEYIKSSGALRENIDRVLKTARSLRAHNASKPRTTTCVVFNPISQRNLK